MLEFGNASREWRRGGGGHIPCPLENNIIFNFAGFNLMQIALPIACLGIGKLT